jgi:hypothetical protein
VPAIDQPVVSKDQALSSTTFALGLPQSMIISQGALPTNFIFSSRFAIRMAINVLTKKPRTCKARLL